MSEPEASDFTARVTWPMIQARDVRLVNQIAIIDGAPLTSGASDGTVYLLLGHLSPPMIPDELAVSEFREGGANLTIEPVAAVALARGRAEELHAVLGRHLASRGEG